MRLERSSRARVVDGTGPGRESPSGISVMSHANADGLLSSQQVGRPVPVIETDKSGAGHT
jgi:hypothetical protein